MTGDQVREADVPDGSYELRACYYDPPARRAAATHCP
jgi:hypothetical protein